VNFFYTALLTVAIPFIIIRLIWRGFRSHAYWHRWSERFGAAPELSYEKPVIWCHAVSVGEVQACRPLIDNLQTQYPDHQILITTMTPTGSERVKSLFLDSVAHCYLPYDLPLLIKRFFDRTHPALAIIMETEIWPNILMECQKREIPLILANARMSARSARGYQRIASFTKTVLQTLPLIAAQSEDDRQRFIQLGADPQRVHAIGNLKFEVKLPASLSEECEVMRQLWDPSRPVWVAASTHEGEEEIILKASQLIRDYFPTLLLILVPRHPERFDRVFMLSQRSGLNTLRRSEQRHCVAETQVLIGDTMGELPLFYGASDLAFIGGTLVAHGGQNLLEPAALGRAIITGPHYFNFHEISKQFLKSGAALEINDAQSLATTVIMLLKDPEKRACMGEAGQKLIAESQGASKRLVDLINTHISYEK